MIDARLLVPAAGVWLGVALVLAVGPWAGTTVVLICLATAGIVRGAAGGGARTALLLVAVFAALGVAAGMSLVWRLTPAPVNAWIDERATAVAQVVVTGEARTRAARTSAAWWAVADQSVLARTEVLSARGDSVQVRLPIRVRLPQGAQAPARGSVIEVTGRLSPMPPASGLAAQLRVPEDQWRLVTAPGPLPAIATGMRHGLSEALSSTPTGAASVVRGLTIGDDSDQPAELKDAMRASGLAHLMAVSGGNVAIVVGVVVGAAALVKASLVVRAAVGTVAVAYYAYLVGPEPSVYRASVMGVIALLAVVTGGRRSGPSILGLAILGLLLTMPWLALSWGFALSCAATAGILLLAPLIIERMARAVPRCPHLVVQATALTVSAQLATLPLLVAMGGAAGWVAVPANLVAMPLVAPVTVLGLLAAIVSPVLPGVAAAMGWVSAWPARGIAWIAETAPDLPFAQWPVGSSWPTGWAGLLLLLLVGVGAAAVLVMRRSSQWRSLPAPSRWGSALLALLLVVVVLSRPLQQRDWPPEDWLVLMCDVGQGDGLLLNVGDGSAVVVDVGSDPELIDDCLADARIDMIPAIVLTHFHADHVGGLAGAMRGREVGAVVASPLLEPRDQSAVARQALGSEGRTLQSISAGDVRRIGDVTWRAIWPRRIIRSGSLPNNASVVLLVEMRGRRILLTGDIEPEAQRALLDDVQGLAPDVVKVPHHGSRNQLRAFAELVRSPIALVSVGADNEYGHPDVDVSSWFVAPTGRLLRSDEDGEVAVVLAEDGARRGMGLGVVVRGGMLFPS